MNIKANIRLLFLLVIPLLIFEGIVFYFAVNKPYWNDEAHFVDTINHFGEDMSISTIKSYNEMSTPLPFILYSFWGRIFDFRIQTLRLFSVLVAFITYLLFHKLVFSIFKDIKISLLTTAFIVLHPYMVGLSVFVFTDMLAILFVILSCIAIREQKPILLSIFLACCLLCRQYLIFFILAAGLYYLIIYYNNKSNRHVIRTMLLSCFISILPLAILVILWKGLCPENDLKNIYLDKGYSFHPSYLNLYICQFSIYLVPIILISWKKFYKNKIIILISFVLSWFYWLFPVRIAGYQIDAHVDSVGFFHRFIKSISGNQFIEDIVFHVAYLLGLPIIIVIAKDIFSEWHDKKRGFPLFLDLSIFAALIVMPFSYYCWEKYFLPFLPLVTLRILLFKYSDKLKSDTEISL